MESTDFYTITDKNIPKNKSRTKFLKVPFLSIQTPINKNIIDYIIYINIKEEDFHLLNFIPYAEMINLQDYFHIS